MARADLLYELVKAGMQSNSSLFRKVVQAIIVEERAKQHQVLAEKLEGLINFSSQKDTYRNNGLITDQRLNGFVHDMVPQKKMDELILPKEIKQICNELIQEHHRSDLLRSYNLEPRNRILLIGPPGNGKTSLAEAIAEALMFPLLVVRYDGVVGTYLGETAMRLRRLFDYVKTRKCVLFFDEFETLGKERGDTHETGEIKRVVSSLLMQIDYLPSNVVVIGATNHAELLDRAVWRRFQIRMTLPQPTRIRLMEWFKIFEKRLNISLGYEHETLAKKLYGASFGEIEEFGATIIRQFVLEQPNSNMKSIVNRTLNLWKKRTVKIKQQGGKA